MPKEIKDWDAIQRGSMFDALAAHKQKIKDSIDGVTRLPGHRLKGYTAVRSPGTLRGQGFYNIKGADGNLYRMDLDKDTVGRLVALLNYERFRRGGMLSWFDGRIREVKELLDGKTRVSTRKLNLKISQIRNAFPLFRK